MIFNYSFSYKQNIFGSGLHPVSVIVNFAVDGRFRPVYFKYYDEDNGYLTFKIDSVNYTKDRQDSILFCCFVTHNSVQQEVNLIYRLNECTWTAGS